MEDYGLVEADFQQYYRLDVSKLRFRRYARLFDALPPESRIMRKMHPASTWTWDNEVMSRILYELSKLNTLMYNINRKKGAKAEKPDEQFQPDYVAEAKKAYTEWREEEMRASRDVDAMKALWNAKNPHVTSL